MARKPKRRVWGSGSVWQRGGRWWIRWREDGKRKPAWRHYSQITPDMVDGGVQALNRAARDPGSAGHGYPLAPRLLGPTEPDGARP